MSPCGSEKGSGRAVSSHKAVSLLLLGPGERIASFLNLAPALPLAAFDLANEAARAVLVNRSWPKVLTPQGAS